MIRRELKSNFKGFIIWTFIMIALYITVFLIYPSMVKDTAVIDEFIKTMDEKMLTIFNMDIIGFETVFGWLATEGYLMLTLVGGCYFAVLGSSIVLKEEDSHTIEFLYSKPISRSKIFKSKIVCGFILVILFNLMIGLTNLIGLSLSNDLVFKKWLLITILPMFGHLFFFALSVLISMFLTKTSKSIGICLGSVFGFYFISLISALASKVEFIKYFTPFHYIEARDIILKSSINSMDVIVMLISIGVMIFISHNIYNEKELV